MPIGQQERERKGGEVIPSFLVLFIGSLVFSTLPFFVVVV